MASISEILAAAKDAYEADLARLNSLDDDQVDYLARLQEVLDGEEHLACDHDRDVL